MHCTCEGRTPMRLLAGRSGILNRALRGLLGISYAAVVILDSWPTVVVGHVMETKASVSHRSPINSYVARPLDRLPPRACSRARICFPRLELSSKSVSHPSSFPRYPTRWVPLLLVRGSSFLPPLSRIRYLGSWSCPT